MPKKKSVDPNIRYYPPRLLKKLSYSRLYPLTLLEAPSGFGKTTILEYFYQTALPETVLRLRYDFEPDQPLEIWHRLCRCIGQIDRNCAGKLLRLGPPDEDNQREMELTLRELQSDREVWLWLDNYHCWSNLGAGWFLNALSDREKTTKVHIVVSSQPLSVDLQKKLTNLGQIWHLPGEELLFDETEVEAYFTQAGLPLSHELVHSAYILTNGWAMALCLQMMNYLSRGQLAGGDMMTLMEQVFWQERTAEERQLLLLLSLFRRFTLQQAGALAEKSCQETEAMLLQFRYFIRYDPETRTCTIHAQLQRFLDEKFARLETAQQQRCYLRAGELAQEEGRYLPALHFFYELRDWERLLSLPISSHEVADVAELAVQPMVLQTLQACPREVKLRHPKALICMALALFISGENGRLLQLSQEIKELIQESPLPEQEKRPLWGEMELLLSFLEYNRISDMSVRHQRALELLGGPAQLITPQNVWTFGSPSVLYLYWRESGKLDEELAEMNRCMPIYYALTRDHGYGAELIMEAEALFLRGAVDEAMAAAYQAMFAARSRHQDSIIQCCLFLLCRIAVQQGKPEDMGPHLQEIRSLAADHADDLSHYTRDLIESYLALLCGRPEEVTPWLAQGDISDKRLMLMSQPLAHAIYGRYLLTMEEYQKVLGTSDYFISLSAVFPNLLAQVYAHIYCAQALFAMGRREQAAGRLQQAMDLAFPDRIYLPFAENFGGICTLLPMTSIHGEALDTVTRLSVPFLQNQSGDTEPFTDREKSIHYLLREQLTNREIGERLHLSPNTVRNHISAMLKKKNVRTREALQQLPEE